VEPNQVDLVAAAVLRGLEQVVHATEARLARQIIGDIRSYSAIKANLMSEAEKMPEADYNLKPGTMPEVRTFGQLFGHVAAGQFGRCAAVKGVPNPMSGKTLEDFKTKADENAMQFVKQRPNELPRAAPLFGLLAHNNERAAAHAAWQLNPFAMSDTLSIAVAQLNPTVGDIQGISHSAFATNILRRNIVEPG
jgi:hypothetical protein